MDCLDFLTHSNRFYCRQNTIMENCEKNVMDYISGSTKTRFKIHDPYNPCDPYDPLTAASFPNADSLFRTAFRAVSHSWMLEMSVICFHLQFLVQFVRIEEDRKRSFLPRLHWPIFCVLKMSNYTAACIIKAVSQLLPNYESRTWDAKTRRLLSYQIVISGKIQYFRT